jgi:hypothetical protein
MSETVSERMEGCAQTSLFLSIEFEKTCPKMGTPTRQVLSTPSDLRKTCPKMGYSHSTNFFRPIEFEKASEKMGPGS